MTRDELSELHYITPIAHVQSIVKLGLLSHNQAAKRKVIIDSVAMQVIQERRDRVVIPGARPLHDYVNLYICARNPMMYKIRDRHAELCVLRIQPEVLDIKDAVVADRNASSNYARFATAPAGLANVDRARVFAEFWIHSENQFLEWEHKAVKCAEVLIPDRLPVSNIFGTYVSSDETKLQLLSKLEPDGGPLDIAVNKQMFFL